MKRVTRYSVSVLLLFFCSVFYGVSQDNQKHYIDSVVNSFEQLTGEEKIDTIANFIRNANFHNIRHERFKPYLEEAYYWENKHRNTKLLNTIRLGHVNILIAEGNNTEAARHLRQILRSGEPLSRKDSLSTYRFLLGIYTAVEAHPEALDAAIAMEKIFQGTQTSDPDFERNQEERLALKAYVFLQIKDYPEAVSAYHDYLLFLENKTSNSFIHNYAGALNNMGLCYLYDNKPDSAILYFEKSVEAWNTYLEGVNTISRIDSAFIDLLYGNIGSSYNLKGEYAKAIPLLKRDLETSLNANDIGSIVNCYHELTASYNGLERYGKALSLLDSASHYLLQHSFPGGIRKNYSLRVEVMEGLGNSAEALRLYKKLVAFNDSMALIKNEARASVMQVIYEVEEKNHEINTQRLRTAEAKAETARQRGLKQTLIIGIALMLLILIILAFNAGQRKKRTNILREKNKQIEQQKATIEEALVEKETLLKEIHHRVKNNLQLISGILELQAVKFDDENVKIVMEEGQSRVRSMALIHQQLYQSDDLGRIDFEEYLIKLVNDIVVAFNNKELKLETEINVNNLSFDVNVAVPLGLIINELVTNALKHGFEGKNNGKISIKIEPDTDDNYTLTVSDDGNGLPENFNPDNSNSLGLRLVKGLSRQLGGSYRFSNGTGTHFIIQFKNNNFNET